MLILMGGIIDQEERGVQFTLTSFLAPYLFEPGYNL